MESKNHFRKLLQLYPASGGDRELTTTVQNATSSSSSTPPPQPPSALDSSMALTIFFFLIALFFMAFFSVFIRHFADDDLTAEISSRHRRTSSRISPRRNISSRRSGLDTQDVGSLPVYGYTKTAKQRIENCVICLSDFEEGETVKVIPRCGHVFHVACVDTWLRSHVSCPFCRSSQLFSVQGSAGSSWRLTAEEDGTWSTGVGPCLRKCSSCSSLEQRTGLERSLSL